jgi:DNA primase
MDLIHAHQGGFGNTVALSGTAFTKDHAKLLLRYSENLMLALDADSAGLTATQKSALAALSEGMHVKVVRLPKGKDPADMLAKSTKEFTALVKSAEPVVDFFLGVLGEREKSSHRLVLLVEKIVLPLIAAIKSPMERAHFTESVARTLGLSPEAVTASVMNLPRAGEEVRQEKEEEHPSAPRSTLERHEERLHALLAAYPGTALAKKVKKEYARITEAPLSKERVSDAAIFEIEHAYGEDPAEESIDELLRAFEGAYVREAYQKAVANLKKAEGSGSTAQIIKAQKEVLELGKRLGALT